MTIKFSFPFVSMLSLVNIRKMLLWKLSCIFLHITRCATIEMHDAVATQPYTSYMYSQENVLTSLTRACKSFWFRIGKSIHSVGEIEGAIFKLFLPLPMNIIIFSLINIIITSKPIPIIAQNV